ncbi:hypothetical protein [Fontibacillus phaseoli]|nr:hypothetical protein [Fontibacillus phaseoli]
MSEACVKGGRTYEYRSHLYHSISRRGDSAVIGAGTVLDPVTARIALLAGAEFVVSPSFEEETAKLCNLYGIPYMPGVQTLGEIKEAMKFGPMY